MRPEASVEGQPLSTGFGGRAAPGRPDRPCSSGAALATRWGEWVVSVQKEFEVLLSKDPKASSKLFFKIIKHRGPLGGAALTWPRVPAGEEWRHFHLTTTKPLTPFFFAVLSGKSGTSLPLQLSVSITAVASPVPRPPPGPACCFREPASARCRRELRKADAFFPGWVWFVSYWGRS